MDIQGFRDMVQNNHRIPSDSEVLSSGPLSQEDQCIVDAVKRYSTRIPLTSAATVSLSGYRGSLSQISGWTQGWNVVDLYQGGVKLPGNTWSTGIGSDGVQQVVAAVSGSVQVVYSRPHNLDSCTTIPAIDLEAVAHLAASLVLNQAANLYAQKKNSSIDADAVDYGRLSGEYFLRSRDELALYEAHMSRRVRKRGATVNWSSRSRSGLGRMFQDDRYS